MKLMFVGQNRAPVRCIAAPPLGREDSVLSCGVGGPYERAAERGDRFPPFLM